MKDPVQHVIELAERALAERAGVVAPLPTWPESRRAAPAAAFRTALFPASARKTRVHVDDLEIFCVGGVRVLFSGKRFDQTDLTVYLEVLHRLRNGVHAEFTAYSMLTALGKPDNKTNYAWLDGVLVRLTKGTVHIEGPDIRYHGHLIEGIWEERKTRHYSISLNAQFSAAFRASWCSLDAQQRDSLGSPTAMALHAYYSSHRNPGRHRRETLCDLVGIAGKNRFQTLRKALDELVEIGFLKSWIEDPPGGITVDVIHTRAETTDIARD